MIKLVSDRYKEWRADPDRLRLMVGQVYRISTNKNVEYRPCFRVIDNLNIGVRLENGELVMCTAKPRKITLHRAHVKPALKQVWATTFLHKDQVLEWIYDVSGPVDYENYVWWTSHFMESFTKLEK